MAHKVLLIENDPKYLDSIMTILESAGLSVFTATNAEVGVSIARNVQPSIVLLNLATPGTNGLDICKTLHSTEGLQNTPIVLLTLRDGNYDPLYESLYGIVGFIKKPVKPEALISEVSKWITLEGAVAPPSAESFDDLMDVFDKPGSPSADLAAGRPLMPPSAIDQDEFKFDDESFADLLKDAGAPQDEPTLTRPPKTTWPARKPNKFVRMMLMASAALSMLVVGFGTFILLNGGGSDDASKAKKADEPKPLFENKTVLPKNADVNGVIPSTTNAPAPSMFMAASNAPIAQSVAPAPAAKPEPIPKPEPKTEAKKPVAPEPIEVEEPAPVKKSKTARPAPAHGHYVQFGVFGAKANADKLISELKGKGFSIIVKDSINRSGRQIFRVLLNELFKSEDAAKLKAKELQNTKDVETSTFSE